MKKKMIAVQLIFTLLLAACGGSAKDTAVTEPTKAMESGIRDVSNQTVGGSRTDDSGSIPENKDAWYYGMFNNPAEQYNNELAVFAARASEKSESETGNEIEQFLADYRIQDVELFNYGGDSAFALGHTGVVVNGEESELLLIVCRGSKTWREFIGDLFKGFLTQLTHPVLGYPIWDNVYDFEEQVWTAFNGYMLKHYAKFSGRQLKLLVTGHSLGGAAANVLGARMTEENRRGSFLSGVLTKSNLYVYTFNAIKVINQKGNVEEGFENIHNVYNYYDSFGPHGNLGITIASDPEEKFGHTDLYYVDVGESLATSNNHINYVSALLSKEVLCYYDDGESGTKNPSPTEAVTPTVSVPGVTETPKDTPTPSPTPEAAITLDWITITDYYTDSNGYRIRVDLKLSPWILLSNQEVLKEAWKAVGKQNELPDLKAWNYKKLSGGSYSIGGYDSQGNSFSSVDGITDLYYSVGSVKYTNVTEGWDVNPENPPKISLFLSSEIDRSLPYKFNNNTFVSMIFYSSGGKKFSNALYMAPQMQSNTWGPATIIIAHPENVVPAYPEGQYRPRVATAKFGLSGLRGNLSVSSNVLQEGQVFTIPFYGE